MIECNYSQKQALALYGHISGNLGMISLHMSKSVIIVKNVVFAEPDGGANGFSGENYIK